MLYAIQRIGVDSMEAYDIPCEIHGSFTPEQLTGLVIMQNSRVTDWGFDPKNTRLVQITLPPVVDLIVKSLKITTPFNNVAFHESNLVQFFIENGVNAITGHVALTLKELEASGKIKKIVLSMEEFYKRVEEGAKELQKEFGEGGPVK